MNISIFQQTELGISASLTLSAVVKFLSMWQGRTSEKKKDSFFFPLTKLSFLYILEAARLLERDFKMNKINIYLDQNNREESLSFVPPTQNVILRFLFFLKESQNQLV